MRSQLRSSSPSLSSGLIQPQVSSSNAQSPELDEATWGEAVDKGEKQNCQFHKGKGGLTWPFSTQRWKISAPRLLALPTNA